MYIICEIWVWNRINWGFKNTLTTNLTTKNPENGRETIKPMTLSDPIDHKSDHKKSQLCNCPIFLEKQRFSGISSSNFLTISKKKNCHLG